MVTAHPADGAALAGATLVLPVVSVGNVPQLAADLLINTLRLPRAARLDDPALLPAVGARAYAHTEGLATALEVYREPGGDVAVAQQRAPAAPGTQVEFAGRLAAWVRASGAKQVLVLGSIEATFRRDAQLAGPQLRYWAPEGAAAGAAAGLAERCASAAGLQPLEASFLADRPLDRRQLQPWPLLAALAAAGVPCAAVLSFCAEGDNVAEAMQLASAAAAAAGLGPAAGAAAGAQPAPAAGRQQQQWVPPPSWQYVYGGSPAVY